MDTVTQQTPTFGSPMKGGFFGGQITIDGALHNLIVAPKALGQIPKNMALLARAKKIEAFSYIDGMANTRALAEAGSKLAQWMLELVIDDCSDFYLPSQDELEILHRNFKPTTNKNWCYGRAGINLHAVVPTLPYTPDFPLQTTLHDFQDGGPEAFDAAWYWSSTLLIADASGAWCQGFDGGIQSGSYVSYELRARAVRRELVI